MNTADISATVRYLVPGVARPVYIASEAGADAALSVAAEFDEREVNLLNARAQTPAPSLDRQGFCLIPHPTNIPLDKLALWRCLPHGSNVIAPGSAVKTRVQV